MIYFNIYCIGYVLAFVGSQIICKKLEQEVRIKDFLSGFLIALFSWIGVGIMIIFCGVLIFEQAEDKINHWLNRKLF